MPIAQFRLKSYIITNTSIKLTGQPLSEKMNIAIKPDGKLEDNVFTLTLNCRVSDEKKNLEIELDISGFFEYTTNDMKALLNFMSINAPAIMFPYIRAYISSLTGLSGIQPIILPTINMQGVGKKLYDKLKATLP